VSTRIRDWQRDLSHETVLTVGDRPCLTCGKPHEELFLEGGYTSWADRSDGHFYRPESWESLGRKYLASLEQSQEGRHDTSE